jgi:hypothetical protein
MVGFSLTKSKQVKGQATTHVPQLTHLPASTTSVSRESSKLILLELMPIA